MILDKNKIKMNIYQISSYGFLPAKCEKYLPENFEYLDYFFDFLDRNQVNFFRNYVDNYIYIIPTEKLSFDKYSLGEIQKIYSMTSLLSQVYLECLEPRLNKIPQCLGRPWYESSQLLGLPCALTHAAIDLYNWRFKDNCQEFNIDNIEPIHLVFQEKTLRKSESGFYTSMIAIEGECGPMIHYMDNIYQILESKSEDKSLEIITKNLKLINDKLKRELQILIDLPTRCQPAHYYHYIRKLLQGSSNSQSSIHLLGLNKELNLEGGSAKQSSLVQAQEIFFGLDCDLNQKMLSYMPLPHRTYLEQMKKRPLLDNFIKSQSDLSLQKEYQNGVNLMILIKNQHISIMQRYLKNFDDYNTENYMIEEKLLEDIQNLGEKIDSSLETDSESEFTDSEDDYENHYFDVANRKYWNVVYYIINILLLYMAWLLIVLIVIFIL